MRLARADCWRTVRDQKQRHCQTCETWKDYTPEFFGRAGRKGLSLECRPCIAARTAARHAGYRKKHGETVQAQERREKTLARILKMKEREFAKNNQKWPAGHSDRETLVYLHVATERWPTHEEGRAFHGR